MFSLADYSTLLLPRDETIQCLTARAPDYYGFGVRLGIYFAWLQAYIANTTLPSEINGALDTNTIFLLTILIAMIKCSSIKMLESVDGLILMHLGGGTIFSTLSLWGYRTRRYVDSGPGAIRFFGGFGTHSRLIVSMGVSVFGLWFWLYGVKGGLNPMSVTDNVTPPNVPECSTLYTFFFAKLRADGGIRIVYIIVCLCCCVYFGTMLLVSTLSIYARVHNMVVLAKLRRWADSSRVRYATGFNYKELKFIFKWLRVLNMVWILWSVLLVEFSLNFNHIGAVLGGPNDNELHLPAQILPLMVGVFGFVRTSYLAFEDWRAIEEESESSTTRPNEHRQPRTMKFGVDMLQAFSPAMAMDDGRKEPDPNEVDEVDELVKKRSRIVRYLVAVLPWLSLLEYFHDKPQIGKRLSMPLQPRERVNSWQDPQVILRKPVPRRYGPEDSPDTQSADEVWAPREAR